MNSPQRSRSIFRFAAPHNFYHLAGRLAPWFAAAALALAQRSSRVDAVLAATLLAWLVYALAIAWVFFARTAWQAWCGVLGPAMLLGLAAQVPQWLAGAA